MIAFVRFESFGAQIWTMQPDGTGAHALTSTGSWNEHPSWSPDGRRLVFSGTRNGNTDLYVLDLQTGRERRLTRTPESEVDPAWSPDNKWIAFSAPTIDGFMAIFLVQPDGRYRNKVTNDLNHKTNPSWSPDGTHILYEHEHFLGHDFDVLYVGVAGGPRSEGWASRFPWSEFSPAWQPRS
jgi:TolB protein